MADIASEISSITLPNGQSYGFKDNHVRESCAALSAAFSAKADISAIEQVCPAFFRNVQLASPDASGNKVHLLLDVARDI